MDWNKKPHLEHVKGDTFCIVTAFGRFPVFRLDKKNAILLDSGLIPEREGIAALLEGEGLRVRAILTSHAHIDHTGNHAYFQEKQGARIYLGPFDTAVVSNVLTLNLYLGGDSYHRARSYAKNLSCRPDLLIPREAETLEVEGAVFRVMKLDGHAPEHLGFVTPDNVAYLADTLMSDDIMDSVHIPYVNCCEMDMESKRRAGALNCDAYILSHNAVKEEVAALSERNIAYMMEKIETTARACNHHMTMNELVAVAGVALGGRCETEDKIRIAEQNIRAYVTFLLDREKLVRRVRAGKIEYIRADLA